jgi:UDP-glucose 4-epimerase
MDAFHYKKYFITGGAGFIGAHLTRRILDTSEATVTVFDNFSNGRRWAFGEWLHNKRLTIIEGDARDEETLTSSMDGQDIVYHLAANADIARAATEPSIDFTNGILTTNNVLEAMRKTGINRIVFTSGSGVYGDVPPVALPENYDHMIPISTYGASKLSSESLISAYCHMFSLTGTVFRFANVVGPHQTHGVAYDFIRRLAVDPAKLKIFGDGAQSKPYIYIDDILNAFQFIEAIIDKNYDIYNVGTQDHLTVRDIADIVCECMQLKNVDYQFTGGARGWKADVPIYRLDSGKIRKMGWASKYNSCEAVTHSVMAMLEDLHTGRIPLTHED